MEQTIQWAINQLRNSLVEIPSLRNLKYNDQEYKLWYDKVETIVKGSLEKEDYIEFKNAKVTVIAPLYEKEIQFGYLKSLKNFEIVLKKIIQKYKIIKSREAYNQKNKNLAESSQRLFDMMQFHPKVVEVSKQCFTTNNYREAILNAFIAFIDYVKHNTGLDLDGDDLMNQAFSFDYDIKQKKLIKSPIIWLNPLTNKTERDEQQGMMFLCKGAVAFVRNPKAHTVIPQTNPLHALEYLSFASLLFRRFDEAKIILPKGKHILPTL